MNVHQVCTQAVAVETSGLTTNITFGRSLTAPELLLRTETGEIMRTFVGYTQIDCDCGLPNAC